jgi:hypothetical protein
MRPLVLPEERNAKHRQALSLLCAPWSAPDTVSAAARRYVWLSDCRSYAFDLDGMKQREHGKGQQETKRMLPMRSTAELSSAAVIGAALFSASQAQSPAPPVGAGHVGTSAPHVGATTPSAIQSTVARHTSIPNVGAWQQGVDARSVTYCGRRFRSYDASSGTYLGRDGRRHTCP